MQSRNGNIYFVKFRFISRAKEFFFNLPLREIELKWNVISRDSNCGMELICFIFLEFIILRNKFKKYNNVAFYNFIWTRNKIFLNYDINYLHLHENKMWIKKFWLFQRTTKCIYRTMSNIQNYFTKKIINVNWSITYLKKIKWIKSSNIFTSFDYACTFFMMTNSKNTYTWKNFKQEVPNVSN